MKQHITKEQWDELTEDQENSWYKFTQGNDSFPDLFANPTIGQMIEFLGKDWWNEIEASYYNDSKFILCNSLWEAVKHKLTK